MDKADTQPISRRILRTLPGPAGHYQFADVLPGEYYLAALSEVDASEFSDPSFFEQLVPASIKISLAEAEAKTQDLKLAGGLASGGPRARGRASHARHHWPFVFYGFPMSFRANR